MSSSVAARYYSSTRFRPECPTCGNPLAQLEESYKRLIEQNKTPYEALESLNIERPCCRIHALWPIVLPLGAFYLPQHEASMLNYLGIKEPDPQPSLVILSLQRSAAGEDFIVSHVNSQGFIGKKKRNVTQEVVREKTTDIEEGFTSFEDLSQQCEIRVQTEPGEIARSMPYELRAFRKDIQVDKVRSYFEEQQMITDE